MKDPLDGKIRKSIDADVLWAKISPLMAGLEPKPAQRRIMTFMHNNRGLLVWHGTGTGKTLASLICAVDFLRRRKRNQVIVICEPSTINSVWKRSIHTFIRCATQDPCPETIDIINRISIMTIDAFQKYTDIIEFVRQEHRHTMLIVDEAHQYKGETRKAIPKTATSKPSTRLVTIHPDVSPGFKLGKTNAIRKACINIVSKVLFLTATPIVNDLQDLKNIFQNIVIVYDPKEEYLDKHDEPHIDLDASNMKETVVSLSNMYDFASDIKNPEEWPDYEIIYGYLYGGTKEYMDTASKFIDLKKNVAQNAIRGMSAFTAPKDFTKPAKERKTSMSTLLTELKTADPSLQLDKFIGLARSKKVYISSKIEFLLGFIKASKFETFKKDSKEEHALVSTEKTNTACPADLDKKTTAIFMDLGVDKISALLPILLEKRYPSLKGRIYIIRGGMSNKSRGIQLEKFNKPRVKGEAGRVMILSKAGNTGLELKAVDYVFVLDGSWTEALFLQIIGRSIRTNSHVGQKICDKEADCANYESLTYCNPALKRCAVKDPLVKVFVLIAENDDENIKILRFADMPEKLTRERKSTLMLEVARLAKDNMRKQEFTATLSATVGASPILPPEFRQWINETFGIKDTTLDIYQAGSIYLTKNVTMIIPITANGIIHHVYNHEKAHLIEKVINMLDETFKHDKKEANKFRFIHITRNEAKKVTVASHPDIDSHPLRQDDCICVYIEVAQSDGFGHFGAFFYDGTSLSFYDSMLTGNTGPYVDEFVRILKGTIKFFQKIQDVNVDYKDNYYSMEDTGGQNNVFNSRLARVQASNRWFLKSLLLGTDAQNQYCYMWAIMYLICKTLHYCKSGVYDDWIQVIGYATNKKIIPLVIVKIFVMMTSSLNQFREFGPLWKNQFVSKWYPCFTSNSTDYDMTLKPANSDFNIYKIKLKTKYLKKTSLTTCWKLFVNLIKENDIEYTTVTPPDQDRYQHALVNVVDTKLRALPPPRSETRHSTGANVWSDRYLDSKGKLSDIVATYLKSDVSITLADVEATLP